MTEPTRYDVGIVGGGPAGLSAAIWLGRYLRSVVLVDSGDPRNWEARGVNGYLGLPGVTPQALRGAGRDEARRYGVVLIDGCVSTVEQVEEERFRLALEAGDVIETRRLLLAIGIKDIWPQVPGLAQCYGETAHHCSDCDGYEARDKKTVVIATGHKAAGMALDLATWTRKIAICTNGAPPNIEPADQADLDRLGIPTITEPIAQAIQQNGIVHALELRNGFLVDCDQIFFAIGHYPADDLGVQLDCERDDEGLIVIDAHHHTSVRNVFAAGDITPGAHLAIRAAAGGATAALAIHHSLRTSTQE
jgi:thioredoxin reductase